jgi:hypothetical protein
MIVGIAVETTVDSKEASAVTSMSAAVTSLRRFGSNLGDRASGIGGQAYCSAALAAPRRNVLES